MVGAAHRSPPSVASRSGFAAGQLVGESLADRLAGGRRLELDDALAIGRGIASALAAVHARGIVHGELHPDSVVLAGGDTNLVDLGMARLGGARRSRAAMYLAPELRRGLGPADPRSDLYALGCLLYEMIAGQPAFGCDARVRLAIAPPEVSAPAPIRALVTSLMARDRAHRPQSATTVALELERQLDQLRAVERAIDELGTDGVPASHASDEDTWKIRIGLTPDWVIVVGAMLCLGAFLAAMVVTRWYLS